MGTRRLWLSVIGLVWTCSAGRVSAQPVQESADPKIKLLHLSCEVTLTIRDTNKSERLRSFSVGASLEFEEPPQMSLSELSQVIGAFLDEIILRAIGTLANTSLLAPIAWCYQPFWWNSSWTPFEVTKK